MKPDLAQTIQAVALALAGGIAPIAVVLTAILLAYQETQPSAYGDEQLQRLRRKERAKYWKTLAVLFAVCGLLLGIGAGCGLWIDLR